MAHIGYGLKNVYFYPFCSNDFHEFIEQCIGCSFTKNAGLGNVNGRNKSEFRSVGLKRLCNPDVSEYPLPLYRCSICKEVLLNVVLSYIVIVALLTVLTNSWSIAVWLKQSNKSPQIVFKISLALSDFLFGAVVLPAVATNIVVLFYLPQEKYYSFYIVTNRDGNFKDYENNWEQLFMPGRNTFTALMLYISQATSLCNILLFNIDRHIAIVYHIKYYQVMTKKKAIFIVLTMWTVITIFGFASTFACGLHVISPFALFLPLVSRGNDMQQIIKIATVYLLALGLLFLANCVVATCTYIKLHNLSKSNPPRQLSLVSAHSIQFLKDKWNRNKSVISLYLSRHVKLPRDSIHQGTSLSNFGSEEEVKNNINAGEVHDIKGNDVATLQENHKQTMPFAISDNKTTQDLMTKNNEKENHKQHLKQVKSTRRSVSLQHSSHSIRSSEYKHAIRTLLLILFSYAFCVIPLSLCLIIFLIEAAYGQESYDNVIENPIYNWFSISVAIFMLSSLRNIFIYSLRNRLYRTNSKKILKKLCCDFR